MKLYISPLRHPESSAGGSSTLPGLDIKNGLVIMGGNVSLYARMLQKFVDSPLYGQLAEAIQNGNPTDIHAHGHALKGVAANLSIHPLFELLQEVEREAKAGTAVPPSDPRVATLDQAYQTARESARMAAENPELLKA